MFNNNNQNVDQTTGRVMVNDRAGLNSFLAKMFGWMSLSVLVSALVAYYVGSVIKLQMNGGSSLVLLLVWFVLPFLVGRQAMKNAMIGLVELMVYAALTGVMFSGIVEAYTGATVTAAFVSSAAVFASMSAIGVITKRNLAHFGTQLFGALIGFIFASLVNMFLHSGPIELFLSFAAVIIFSLLTMYDTHVMKQLYNNYAGQISANGLAINGALELYLDFINLFISLLQIFGGFGNNNN